MPKYLGLSVFVAVAVFASQSVADPPPARPDYVATITPKQWTFAKLLWQGREPCAPDQCEAGYYDAPLMVSVQRQTSSNPENNSVEAVAGIQGCESVSWNLMWEKDFGKLSADEEFEYVANRVRSLAVLAEKQCNIEQTGVLPTEGLKRLFTK
jgi:hypothetical protein